MSILLIPNPNLIYKRNRWGKEIENEDKINMYLKEAVEVKTLTHC